MKSFPFFKALFFLLALLPQASLAQSTILVFGDSLSAGYGIPREQSWPVLLQQELNKTHPHYKVVNASVSGETTSGGVSRLAAALQAHKPAIVILELGANDGLRGTPLDITEQNLNKMVKMTQKAHAKVLLAGMKLPPNYGLEYSSKFNSIYSNTSKKFRIPAIPFLLQGISAEQFQSDNLHPIAEAQPMILRTVMKTLKPML